MDPIGSIQPSELIEAAGAARREPDAPRLRARDAEQAARRFRDSLARAEGKGEAREAAEQLVSNAFIQPVLKMLREGNDAPPPWGPGEAEKQFGPLLDQRLADEIVRAADYPLVERVTRELTRSSEGGA